MVNSKSKNDFITGSRPATQKEWAEWRNSHAGNRSPFYFAIGHMVRINGEALFATKVERDYTFYSKDKDGNYYKNNVAKGDYVALSDHDNSPQYALTQKEYFDALITRNPYYHTQNTEIIQEEFEKSENQKDVDDLIQEYSDKPGSLVEKDGVAFICVRLEKPQTFDMQDRDGVYRRHEIQEGDFLAINLSTMQPEAMTKEDFEKCLEIDDRSIESPEEEKEDRSQD